MSKIVEIKNLKFEVENYDTKLNIAEFEGKFTSVDLQSLEVQYKYPKCNNTVSTDDENAKCGKCATVTIGDNVVVILMSRVLLWTQKQNLNTQFQ